MGGGSKKTQDDFFIKGCGILEIIKIKIDDIKPYKNNVKIHTKEQIKQIKKSIQEFGMNDPIAVWGKDNIIVEGHGRLEALKELGYTEVDCIRLDHLTDEERKAYTLAHNKLTMNTDFDFDILYSELENIENIDMSDFGFDLDFEEEEIKRKDLSENIEEEYMVVIDCKDEQELEETFTKLQEEGYNCRIST